MNSNLHDGNSAQAHSHRNQFENYRKQYVASTPWVGHVDAKLDIASPYNFFLTRIRDSKNTYDEDLTISFPELLDSSLGVIKHSLHVNFMVEFDWLLAQYLIVGYKKPSMTILCDSGNEIVPSELNGFIKFVRIESPFPYGHHHTKMSIFFYTDRSLRIAIYTANLIESDWENRTQGVWISPQCPYLGDDVPINYGESETLFKYEILKYLNSYHLPELKRWLVRIQKTNMSEIRVCLVPSIPGEVIHSSGGYKKMNKLLKDNVPSEYSSWDLVAQCSSIGSLGSNPESWLSGELARNLNGETSKGSSCQVKLIYPSFENVRQSHDGLMGGACLPYGNKTHQKQLWLRKFLFQWKSDHRHRSKAVPHIKSYAKLSPDGKKIAWFLLTSANLSKAAWGKQMANGKVKILSHELGVLFLPCFLDRINLARDNMRMVLSDLISLIPAGVAGYPAAWMNRCIQTGKNYFDIKQGGNVECDREPFPVPYDIPITSYREYDKIFLHDKALI